MRLQARSPTRHRRSSYARQVALLAQAAGVPALRASTLSLSGRGVTIAAPPERSCCATAAHWAMRAACRWHGGAECVCAVLVALCLRRTGTTKERRRRTRDLGVSRCIAFVVLNSAGRFDSRTARADGKRTRSAQRRLRVRTRSRRARTARRHGAADCRRRGRRRAKRPCTAGRRARARAGCAEVSAIAACARSRRRSWHWCWHWRRSWRRCRNRSR